ncbi:hypothetical protein [Flavobacterium sp.]|uniref:hypothetical protein n=1 Tax=Flavobacterium sp. TaxID=239 RepID=UPI0011FA7FD5|nr:hypothetical protein [Flavobacterium sp.]RZJ71108.1 MAG: hypothetical protein EOO49_11700 [Flavobacterium sp.]
MISPHTYTLMIKLSASIETPPLQSREQFRECAIRTLLSVTKNQDVSVEYIGYKADPIGIHHLDSPNTEYEDSVFASITLNRNPFLAMDESGKKDDLLKEFISAFENTTHRHLAVDSEIEDERSHEIEVELSSDWQLHLKKG